MPLSKFQSSVLRTLAAQPTPDSYIAGGIAINRDGPRFSHDIDMTCRFNLHYPGRS
jgi:hypothetical protein